MSRQIDHLVYAVPELDAAIGHFENLLGIAPVFGGYHRERGTKNALLQLGNGAYLEIIAADNNNTFVAPPRWMGVDVLTTPKLTRWCLKSDDLNRDQAISQVYNFSLATPWQGQRTTADGELLSWQMLLPLPTPEVEIMPFMVDWGDSAFHPTDRLASGCELLELELIHPEPLRIVPYLEQLGVNLTVKSGTTATIRALIRSPQGDVWI